MLLEAPQSPHTTVVVPTSDTSISSVHKTNTGATNNSYSGSDGVDSSQFYRALMPICEKLDLE